MKSRQSAAVWSSILKHDALPHNVARAAVESFLCCHSGSHNDSTRDWLEEAVQRVKAGRVHEPGLGLHLSLAYALLGDSVHSLDAYREYLRTSRSDQPAVGQQLVNRKCRNPWQHLMQLMNLSKQPLTAMKILWRFQATYPFLNDIGPSLEGELSNETLNLTMTPEGFLTGDMQMQLPPVQSVFLDPYTGQRSINNGRRPTHVWTEGRLAKKCERLADYFWMPTDFNVYHDDNGNRVTLKLANSKIVDNKMLKSHSTQMMQLYWRGADGQTAHLDLYSIIQRRSREINAINFKSGYGAKYSYINKQYPELVSEAFDMCEKQRWHFKAVEHYLRHVDSRLSKKKKGNDVLKLNDNNERKVMREQMSGLPFVVRISNFIQFKDHLCIHFIAGQGSSEIYCMFFDCTNAETFREPVVRHMTEHNNMLAPAEFDLADHSRHPEWGMVGCCQLYTVLTWMFRNGKGEYLGEVATKASSVIKLIKEKTVFWNKTSVTLCRRQFDHQEEPQEDLEVKTETPILAMDCLGSCEVILLHTEDGVAFLDPETLERIKISLLDGQKLKLEISDEGKFINGSFTHVKVVGRKTFHSEVEVRRVYVAIDNTLLTMDVTTPVNSSKTSITVTVSMELVLSGYPTEVCYISREAGFLVSTSMDANREKKMSREHILHFDYDGLLCGILPFLGPGPRSFYPVYLPGNLELIAKSSDHGKSGWHVFFRDGHGGICCLRAGLH